MKHLSTSLYGVITYARRQTQCQRIHLFALSTAIDGVPIGMAMPLGTLSTPPYCPAMDGDKHSLRDGIFIFPIPTPPEL